MKGFPALVLVLSLGFAGCVDPPENEDLPVIIVEPGFYWSYGDLRLWHRGNGYVMDASGREQAVNLIVVELPVWMRFDLPTVEYSILDSDREKMLQVQLAVSQDLQTLVAFWDVCPERFAEHTEGPWRCIGDAQLVYWHPGEDGWFFGLSRLLRWGSDRSTGPADKFAWEVEQVRSGLRVSGNSTVLPRQWMHLPLGMLAFFQQGTAMFDSSEGPPVTIEVARPDGVLHNFTLQEVGRLEGSQLADGPPGVLALRPQLTLEPRSDFLPFDGDQAPGYDFSWSEVWPHLAPQVEDPARAVVLRGGPELWLSIVTGGTTATELAEWLNGTFIMSHEGGQPFAFHLQRERLLPPVQDLLPASEILLKRYRTDYFPSIESEQLVHRIELPAERVALADAFRLTEWITGERPGSYGVFTDVQDGSAVRIVYLVYGKAGGFVLDAGTGFSLVAGAVDGEQIARFWSPSDPLVPYRPV